MTKQLFLQLVFTFLINKVKGKYVEGLSEVGGGIITIFSAEKFIYLDWVGSFTDVGEILF